MISVTRLPNTCVMDLRVNFCNKVVNRSTKRLKGVVVYWLVSFCKLLVTYMTCHSMISMVSVKVVSWTLELVLVKVVKLTFKLSNVKSTWTRALVATSSIENFDVRNTRVHAGVLAAPIL